jgi:hypothetical protein
MAVTPYTTNDLAKIRQALINGVQRVRFTGGPDAGREVTYRTLDELKAIESLIVSSLLSTPRPKQLYPVASKGL